MLKRTFKKFLGILLCLSIVATATLSGSLSVRANIFLDYAVTKLLDTGMRVCSECTVMLADATGNAGYPGAEKGLSFINDWVFTDGSDKAMKEIKELCQQILEELDMIEQEMTESFAQIQSVMAQSEVRLAKTRVDNKWSEDVDGVFRSAKAVNALSAYKTYLKDAADSKPDSVLQADFSNLMKAYSQMYSGTIPINSSDTESLKRLLFEDAGMNNAFISLITNLAQGLNYDSISSGSVALYASQFAYLAYPFSHQQYQYLHSIMEKQILQVILAEMMYNEYLYQQGVYFRETYGEDSDFYQSYLGYQKGFCELMAEGDNSVNSKINHMLSAKMNVDGVNKIYLSLDDYMRPEDAVSVSMKINGYESSHNFKKEVENALHNTGYLNNIRKNTNISNAAYIGETVKFRRVMTHTAAGSQVFYIIDPDQFKSAEALSLSSIDNCIDISGQMDVHCPTCDYVNLMKEMTDGNNTYQAVCDYTCDAIDPLFATNAFSLRGDTINSYLNDAVEYLPKLKSSGGSFKNCYILTPMYRYSKYAALLYTSYVQYKVLDGSKQFTGGNLSLDKRDGYDEIDMNTYQDSTDVAFSVILSNTGKKYYSQLGAEVSDYSQAAIRISVEGTDQTIQSGQSMKVESGKKLTIRISPNGDEPLSLELVRSGDISNKTVVLSQADFETIYNSEEDCYELEYTMPYSDATFMLNMKTPYYMATARNISNGQITFSLEHNQTSQIAKAGDLLTFYIYQDFGYSISSLTVKDAEGNTFPQDQIIFTDYGMVNLHANRTTAQIIMPESNVTITASLKQGNNVFLDANSFIKDENGSYTSFLYLEDPLTKKLTTDPITLPYDSNDIICKAEIQEGVRLESITVRDSKTGKIVFSDSFEADTDTYTLKIDQKQVGENYIVFPTFVKQKTEPVPDKPVDYGIRTYEELAEFARLVDEDYEHYGNAHVWLENNIKAPENTVWEKGIGSVAENKPFVGTFDGKGYVIHGLSVSGESYAGLFESIGKGGTVKDLALIDGQISAPNGTAGGIAAVNEGTIDHCISGINTDTTKSFKNKNGVRINASELGLTVYGDLAGGIAGLNKGSIIGTRNRSYVLGKNCAGIAGENQGSILSCANNGPIGKNSSEVKKAAGITVFNKGTVYVTYNSGKITLSSRAEGACLTLESDTQELSSFYYAGNSSYPAVGSQSPYFADKDFEGMNLTDMQTADFVDRLNKDELNAVTWILPQINNTFYNQGLPVIQGTFLQQATLYAGSNITVSGMMHPSLKVSYNQTANDIERYQEAAQNQGGTVSAVYDATFSAVKAPASSENQQGSDTEKAKSTSTGAALTNSSNDIFSDFVPTELWCAGVTIRVPVKSADAKIIFIDENDQTRILTPDSIEDGMATFRAAEPISFAVMEGKQEPVPSHAGETVDTGDDGFPVLPVAFTAMLSVLLVVYAWRKRKISDKES